MGWDLLWGFMFGLVVALVTTPVGVSGAVFLLPFQLSVLNVPSPAVSPTNLLYNVISVPGALVRYRHAGSGWAVLARVLVAGTVPGVVVGAMVRIYVVPGGTVFRLLVAALLAPLGIWLVVRERLGSRPAGPRLAPPALIALGFAAGLVGGIYGIGGGSLLAPVLVGSGFAIAQVAPAALLATFVTSCVGAATFGLLALLGRGGAEPDWSLGIACGVGGLIGGYLGAAVQPHVPQRGLRLGLGLLALALSVAYVVAVATP